MAKEWFGRKSLTLTSEKIDLKVKETKDLTVNGAQIMAADSFLLTALNDRTISMDVSSITSINQLGAVTFPNTFRIEKRQLGPNVFMITIPRFEVLGMSAGNNKEVTINFTEAGIQRSTAHPIVINNNGTDLPGRITFSGSSGIKIKFLDSSINFTTPWALQLDCSFPVAPKHAS